MELLVLTISDRAARGDYEDRSGPGVSEVVAAGLPEARIERLVVSDDPGEIERALSQNADKDVILTTGGTGIGPRDNTPDVTGAFCDRLIPGIAEHLRRESCAETLNAVVSRGVAGVSGSTLIVNLPGSVRGAVFCARLLVDILPHAVAMIGGGGH